MVPNRSKKRWETELVRAAKAATRNWPRRFTDGTIVEVDQEGTTLVVSGDTPLFKAETLKIIQVSRSQKGSGHDLNVQGTGSNRLWPNHA